MTQYAQGAKLEYAVRDFLKKKGYEVVRAAGSKGCVDLVAIHPGEVLLIQCKKTESTTTFWDDKQKLEALRVPRNVQRQLWVKKDGTIRVMELIYGKWELRAHMTPKEFKEGIVWETAS